MAPTPITAMVFPFNKLMTILPRFIQGFLLSTLYLEQWYVVLCWAAANGSMYLHGNSGIFLLIGYDLGTSGSPDKYLTSVYSSTRQDSGALSPASPRGYILP